MYRTNNPEAVYWQDQAMLWAPRILGALAILIIALSLIHI